MRLQEWRWVGVECWRRVSWLWRVERVLRVLVIRARLAARRVCRPRGVDESWYILSLCGRNIGREAWDGEGMRGW